MKRVVLYLYVLLFLWGSVPARGQSRSGKFLESRLGVGRMLPHTTVIESLRGNVLSFDLQWGIATSGEHYWEQAYRKPNYGLGFHYSNMFHEAMGESYALYGFLDLPVYARSNYRVGINVVGGFAYHTNPLDLEKNPDNYALTTPGLALIEFGAFAEYFVNSKWSVTAWSGISHMSNGAYRKPNKGMNAFLVRLGMRYYFNLSEGVKDGQLSEPSYKTSTVDVYTSLSRFMVSPDSKRYNGRTLQLAYHHRMNYKRRLGLGVDLLYNESLEEVQDNRAKTSDLHQLALVASHEAFLNKVSVLSQIGVYVWNGNGKGFYERIAVRYWWAKNTYIHLGLKARWASAEWVEFGLGYSF